MSSEVIDDGILDPMGEYHPWLRPLHRLLDLGKPIGDIVLLSIHPEGKEGFALAAMQRTEAGRVIFWQPLPRGYARQVAVADRRDHLTLELARAKTHVTSPRTKDFKPLHELAGSLEPLPGTGLTYWFSLLIRWQVLEQYPAKLERGVPLSKKVEKDAGRRKAELLKAFAGMRLERIVTPGRDSGGDYALVALLLVESGREAALDSKTCSMLLARHGGQVQGLRDDARVPFADKRLAVGETELVIAAASPPGNLLLDVLIRGPAG